jgi:hypothetical protein
VSTEGQGRRRYEVPRMEINRAAPAIGSAGAMVNAPINVVWEVLIDLDGWPKRCSLLDELASRASQQPA